MRMKIKHKKEGSEETKVGHRMITSYQKPQVKQKELAYMKSAQKPDGQF